MSTTCIFIRHGETDWNLQKRYLGSSDIGLNARGVKQATDLSTTIERDGISAVYASDLKRATAFARIVFPAHEIKTMPAFREMNFGIFEGLTHEDIVTRHPEIYSRWLNDPFTTSVPQGESFEALSKRVHAAVASLAVRHRGETVAVVTHSGPIRAMLHDTPTIQDFWGMRPENGGMYTVMVS